MGRHWVGAQTDALGAFNGNLTQLSRVLHTSGMSVIPIVIYMHVQKFRGVKVIWHKNVFDSRWYLHCSQFLVGPKL